MTGRLSGRKVVITGGGAGIGLSTARVLVREGAAVALLDLDGAVAQASAKALAAEGDGQRAFGVVCDVTDAASVDRAVAAAREALGPLDGLFNNAGIAGFGSVHDTTPEGWQKIWAVNVTGTFLASRAVLPEMIAAKRGAIVNVGSVSGIRWTGVPYIAYSTSKGAVIPFTRSVALQYAAKGVRCNAILPGLMNTPMIVEPLKGAYGGGDVAAMIAARDRQCPMGFMGDAWDVARAALFLASDESRYVTGVALPVDGGITGKFA